MPSKTEQAIERVRRVLKLQPIDSDMVRFLAEHDRLKAALARLTTLRPTRERPQPGERVLCWRRKKPFCVEREVLPDEEWTPLPEPKEADREKAK